MATLAAAGIALGVALLAPRLYSDPVGVDPYLIRVSAVSLALVAAVWWAAGLRLARGVLIALLAVCLPFSVWLATPRLCTAAFGERLSYPAQLALAGAFQMALVGALTVVARHLPSAERPAVRLTSFRRPARLATVAGIALFLGVVMLLPARWLGREALQPAMLARDGLWLVAAGALQAAAQEVAFRGMLLGALERGAGPLAANLAQAVLFSLAHLAVQYEGPAGPFVPVTIVLGLGFGFLTQRTGSLWPAIVIHAVADVAVTVGVVAGLYGY